MPFVYDCRSTFLVVVAVNAPFYYDSEQVFALSEKQRQPKDSRSKRQHRDTCRDDTIDSHFLHLPVNHKLRNGAIAQLDQTFTSLALQYRGLRVTVDRPCFFAAPARLCLAM